MTTAAAFGSSASGTNWSNTGNLYALDTAYCTYAKTGGGTGDTLTITGFGFAIPSDAIILGFTTAKRRKAGANNNVAEYILKLVKAGAAVGSNRASAGYWTTSDTTTTAGGASDLWGTTWTPAEVNASNFGIQIQEQFSGTGTAYIDSVEITVHYVIGQGPNSPTAASGWTNSSNVYSSNNTYATFGHNNGDTSPALDVTGFGFSLPSAATVDGIVVNIERSKQTGLENGRDQTVILLDGGSEVGNNKAVTGTNWPSSDAVASYGGSADLWGTTGLTGADINASNFGVRIKSRSTGFSAVTVRIDHVTITVYYTVAGVLAQYYQRQQQGMAA